MSLKFEKLIKSTFSGDFHIPDEVALKRSAYYLLKNEIFNLKLDLVNIEIPEHREILIEIINDKIEILKERKYYLNKEINLFIKIKSIFLNRILKHSSLMNVQGLVLGHYVLRQRSRYLLEVLKKIEIKFKNAIKNNKEIKERARLARFNYDLNKRNFNILNIENCSEDVTLSDIEEGSDTTLNYRIKNNLKYKYCNKSNLLIGPQAPPVPGKARDLYLLKKIKLIISQFKELRMSYGHTTFKNVIHSVNETLSRLSNTSNIDQGIEMTEIYKPCEYAVPEMDKSVVGEDRTDLSVDIKSNVILTSAESSSVAQPLEYNSFSWLKYVSGDVTSEFVNLTDRWLKIKTFNWDTTSRGYIFYLDLPKDAVFSAFNQGTCNMPNLIPFKVHRYCSMDLEVKIQINSNKFQIGQLMCCWWYQPDLDANFSLRENVFSGSLTDHCLINAGASNEGILQIPYKYHLPLMTCKRRNDMDDPLNMGRLICFVLNPLSVVSTGPKSCSGTVFIRFKNAKFTGMLSGEIDSMEEVATHEMDKILGVVGSVATNVLTNAINSSNEDNPPHLNPPSFLVPTASHSWSLGTNITEPLQMLRLDNRGKTNQPNGCINEMDVSSVVKKLGLVRTIHWSKSRVYGDLLLSMNAAPIMELRQYDKMTGRDASELDAYYIPPVGVVSSMFSYWRGSLQYKFDIVASQFHTGRLIVAYVPGATETSNLSVENLYASPHIIYDLQETQSFTFDVPYISNKPFWNRQYMGNYDVGKSLCPSRIYMCVVNPLVVMDSVVDEIYINMYMCGGPDFEVSVPVQPSFGLAFNRQVLYDTSETIQAIDGYFPYYTGWWHTIGGQKCVLRYGPVSDHVAQFPGDFVKLMLADRMKQAFDTTKKWVSYYYEFLNLEESPKYSDTKGVHDLKYILIVGINNPPTYFVGLGCANEENAKKAAKAYYNSTGWNLTSVLPYIIDLDGSADYTPGNPILVVKDVSTKDGMCSSFELVEPQMNSVNTNLMNINYLTTTNSGCFLFGESFSNLMDYARRYQWYCSFKANTKSIVLTGQCSLIIPILPQGLELALGTRGVINEFGNRCRDGPIPIICSGFRYYRGSIRIRIVCPSANCLAWVQHRPDRKLRNRVPVKCSSVETAEGIMNHGYAYYVQDLNVNSIIEVEIPFYQNSAFGLLQTPLFNNAKDYMNYFGLGELALGFIFPVDEKKNIDSFLATVFYSLADDMELSTFQGFPPVVILDEIKSVDHIEVAVPEGLFDKWISEKKNDIKQGIRTEIIEGVRETIDPLATKLDETLSGFKFDIGDIASNSSVRNLLSNLAHVVSNLNVKSVSIAIISILVDLGVVTMKFYASVLEIIVNYVKTFSFPNEAGEKQNEPVEVEVAEIAVPNMGDDDVDATSGFIAIIWSGLCTLFGIVKMKKYDVGEFSKLLTNDMGNGFKSANALFIFVRNILKCLDAMKCKLFGYVSPAYKYSVLLKDSYPEYVAWANMVISLDDPEKIDKHQYSQRYRYTVAEAYARGTIIYRAVMESQDRELKQNVIKIYDRIREIKQKLVHNGQDAFVRKECFTIWQFGEPGVGKSTLSHDLSLEMLKHRNVRTEVPPIYNHEASSQYWDTCVGNPVMLVDDLFNVQTGDIFERHLGILFSVVSPVVLAPPKAHLEDKGKPYNPEIFFINSNYGFLRFNGIHETAIHRRRDFLFRSELKKIDRSKLLNTLCPHCIEGKSLKDTPLEFLRDYHHLNFFIYKNVLDRTSAEGPFDYVEFKKKILDRYDQVMDKNEELYLHRVKELEDIEPDLEDDDIISYQEQLRRVQAKIETYSAKLYKDSVYDSLVDCVHFDKIKNLVLQCQNNLAFSKDGFKRLLDKSNPFHDSRAFEEISAIGKQYKNMFNFWPTKEQVEVEVSVPEIDSALGGKLRSYNYFVAKRLEKEVSPRHIMFLGKLGEYSKKYRKMMVALLTEGDLCGFDQNCMVSLFYFFMNSRQDTYTINRLVEGDRDSAEYFCEMLKVTSNLDFNPCPHFFMDPSKCVWDIEKQQLLTPDGVDVNIECNFRKRVGREVIVEPGMCIWSCTIFQHYWYERYLVWNPSILVRVNSHIDSRVRSIPPVFRKNQNIEVIPDTRWNCFVEDMQTVAKVAFCVGKNILSKFISYLENILSFVWNNLYSIISIVSLISMQGLIGYSIYKTAVDVSSTSVPQSSAYGVSSNISLPAHVPIATPQNSLPQMDVVIKRVQENFFRLDAHFEGKKMTCTGVSLYGRNVLMVRHFFEEMDALPPETVFMGCFPHLNDAPVVFRYRDCKKTFFNIKSEENEYRSHICILELPLLFSERKDLRPFIATSDTHRRFNGKGQLIQNNGCIFTNLNIIRENAKMIVAEHGNSSKVVMMDKYTYPMHGKGLCGSILVGFGLERPILGIHVAGVEIGNIRGISEILTAESFGVFQPKEKTDYRSFILPELDPIEKSKLEIQSSLYPYGTVSKEYSIHQSSKTSFQPSIISGVFPIKTDTAPLGLGDKRLPPGTSPLACGVAHLGRPAFDIEEEILKDAVDHLDTKIYQSVVPVRENVGIVPLEQVIVGNNKVPFFYPLEWTTSPGFPLRFEKHEGSGKKWLFDLEETTEGFILKGLHPKLETLLKIQHNMRLLGVKPFNIFIDCLKDETLPIQKCSVVGKTRIFSIAPLQFTLIFKQYFLDFMASFLNASIEAENGIAINPESNQWTDLVRYLSEVGDKFVCGDYKNFGPGLIKQVGRQAFQIILNWYERHGDGANNEYRKILISEILDAPHLCLNLVYFTPGGIPSGSPITTPLNTLCGLIYIRCLWLKVTKLPLNFFSANTRCCVVGDDIIMSVSDTYIDIFNTVSIGIGFREYNICFTDCDKSGADIPYRNLNQASFLKRGFITHPYRRGIWLAPLDKISIEGCANWVRKTGNIVENTITNARMCLELAHSWGPAYFDFIRDSLLKAMRNHQLKFEYKSWRELDIERYSI